MVCAKGFVQKVCGNTDSHTYLYPISRSSIMGYYIPDSHPIAPTAPQYSPDHPKAAQHVSTIFISLSLPITSSIELITDPFVVLVS